MSMDQRLRNLEVFSQISTEMAIMHAESLRRTEEQQQLLAEQQRRMEEQQRRMEEQQRRMEEQQRLMAERQQQIEADQRRRGELIDQMLQLVAVMQADIVRIDETRGNNEDE